MVMVLTHLQGSNYKYLFKILNFGSYKSNRKNIVNKCYEQKSILKHVPDTVNVSIGQFQNLSLSRHE